MKGLRILFLALLGFLFVSVAEAKTDIHANDGFEVVINTLDFDRVVLDYTAIKTNVNYGNYLVINVFRDIIIKNNKKTNLSNCSNLLIRYDSKTIKAYEKQKEPIESETYSNPGKLNLSVNTISKLKLSRSNNATITRNKKGRCLDTGELSDHTII